MQEPAVSARAHPDIETIVRVVLDRLRAMHAAPLAQDAASIPHAESPQSGSTLVLDRQLITLQDLKGRLAAVKVLQVHKRAVVTPAVQDELRSRGVALQRLAVRQADKTAAATGELLVITTASKESTVAERLQALAAECSVEPDDLSRTVEQLAAHFRSGRRAGIWCSSRPYAALRAAATMPPVSAVQLIKPSDLNRALDQAHPNTLIVDDRDWSAAAVANLARAWTRSFTR